MSLVLDWRYDKNRILETHLNEIYSAKWRYANSRF